MKKITLLLSLVLIAFVSVSQQTINLNTSASSIKWIGSKVKSQHEGNIDFSKGHLIINDGKLTGGEFVIDMTTITCTDIEDEKYQNKLVDHLKDPDFFDVDNFKTSKVKITKVKYLDDNLYSIECDLTIKDITNAINFDAIVEIKGDQFYSKATIIVDRTKWGINYKSTKSIEAVSKSLILDDFQIDLYLLSQK